MEKHELKERLELLQKNVEAATLQINLDEQKASVTAYEHEMVEPGFWDDQHHAQQVVSSLKQAKDLYETWHAISENTLGLLAMFDELEQKDYDTFEAEIIEVEKQYDKASLTLFFKGAYDKGAAIMTIKAGAGGDDAEDFAGMILRMYSQFFQTKNFGVEVHEYNEGAGDNGIKKATLEITGSYAFGLLKGEKGVHRLVRLSPFKSSDSRQTSFAHVDVMPLFDEADQTDLVIKDEDLRIDTFRSSGSGGQKVNKTDSAVRITHIPSGVVVACQVERSQHANRDRAMKLLRSKLWQQHLEELQKEKKELQGDMVSVDWGKQIRSYVLHPYKMVKDHRTGVEISHVDNVLGGDIEPFIEAELRMIASGEL